MKNIPDYEMDLAKFIRDFHPEHPTLEKIDAVWYGWNGERSELLSAAIEAARTSRRKNNPLETRKETYTTYDVVYGRCFNERGNDCKEIANHIEQVLKANKFEIEYISTMFGPETWPVYDVRLPEKDRPRRLIVFYVTGSSEGHYVHIEYSTHGGKIKPIFFIKTFEGEDTAARMVAVLSKEIGV